MEKLENVVTAGNPLVELMLCPAIPITMIEKAVTVARVYQLSHIMTI